MAHGILCKECGVQETEHLIGSLDKTTNKKVKKCSGYLPDLRCTCDENKTYCDDYCIFKDIEPRAVTFIPNF